MSYLIYNDKVYYSFKKIYLNSDSTDELLEALGNIEEYLANPRLYEENRMNLESIKFKIQLKYLLLSYFEKGYRSKDYEQLINAMKEIYDISLDKKYNVTIKLINNINIIKELYPLIKDIDSLKRSMVDGLNNRLLNNVSDYQSIIEDIEKRKLALSKYSQDTIYPEKDAKDFSIVKKVNDEFSLIINIAKSCIKDSYLSEQDDFINKYTKDIKFLVNGNSLFYPDINFDENHYANLLVLNTPINEEGELYAYYFSLQKEVKMVVLDSLGFKGLKKKEIDVIFEALENRNYSLLLEGLSTYSDNKNLEYIYLKLLEYSLKNNYVFIIDNKGENSIYYDFKEQFKKHDRYSIADFSFAYLSMPNFKELNDLLIDEELISEENKEEYFKKIKDELPFMGFVGLNQIFIKKSKDSLVDWLNIGRKLSNENYKKYKIDQYLENIPNQFLLIDYSWGDYSSYQVKGDNKKKEFDYDDLNSENINNIKKIIDGDFNLFEKCGLLARYGLLCGDDVSKWPEISEEIQRERIENTTHLIFKVLSVDLKPRIEIHNDLGGDIIGQCCDGGKIVKYARKIVNDYDQLIDTILHESFHAFQHAALNTIPYGKWFFKDLGIMPNRVQEWKINHLVYCGDTQKDFYRHQIYEADAYAFSKDCIISSGLVWNDIDFE